MKTKKLLFHAALVIGFILLGCSSDDVNSDSNSASFRPKAPTGKKNQTFIQGATLNDIVVQGENIKWYKLSYSLTAQSSPSNDNLAISPLQINKRILLNPETPLQNKNVYYATQTVNNLESEAYFGVAVTVQNVN